MQISSSSDGKAAALGLLLLTISCSAEDSSLWGTINGTFDLDYEGVRAYRLGPELVVAYEKSFELMDVSTTLGRPIKNQVARLTLDTSYSGLRTDEELRFDEGRGEAAFASVRRYVVEIDASGQAVQGADFPKLAKGLLTMHKLGTDPGQTVSGDFSCEFVNGLNLIGHFNVRLAKP